MPPVQSQVGRNWGLPLAGTPLPIAVGNMTLAHGKPGILPPVVGMGPRVTPSTCLLPYIRARGSVPPFYHPRSRDDQAADFLPVCGPG
jgi:hypothetical protein